MVNRISGALSSVAVAAAMLSGCAFDDADRLATVRAEIDQLDAANDTLISRVSSLESELRERGTMAKAAPAPGMLAQPGPLLPPNAVAGECYARVFVPAQYETVTKTVLAKAASDRIEVSPARYEWAEEQVLVSEASSRVEVRPARYEWIDEQIVVTEASERLVVDPAVYDTVSEQVMVRPATTVWKKGRGPLERIDEATGEIMCLVEVPAQYRTVTKQVLVTPAQTRTIQVPEVTKTLKRRLMVEPPQSVTIDIPAEYKTVRVKKLVEPAAERRVPIPEVTQQVNETRLVAEARMDWLSILCETNTTPDIISKLQRALSAAGYSAGAVDGRLGASTMRALNAYQDANGLPSGKLTMETLKRLGVM